MWKYVNKILLQYEVNLIPKDHKTGNLVFCMVGWGQIDLKSLRNK